jgi:hypothetical protein
VRASGDHHEIVLARGPERVRLRVRGAGAANPTSLRIAAWAIDVDRTEAISEAGRDAVGVFARALAAASRR